MPFANVPPTLRAGDSVSWSASADGYLPAAGWSLKYRLLWPAGAAELAATAAGSGWSVAQTSVQTSAWPAGSATLIARVEKGTGPALERVTLGSMAVTILPDLNAATQYDGRSQAQRGLDDANAALTAYLAGGKAHVAEYGIAGRQIKFRSVDEIRALIEHYTRQVSAERAATALLSGLPPPGRIYSRF
jgi:hypothetical protein